MKMTSRWFLLAAAGFASASPGAEPRGGTVTNAPYIVLRHGNLTAVVADNRPVDDAVLPGHKAGYHGLASLTHSRQPRSLFVPAYSGLNFEHIHDGSVRPRDILFEPRRAPMELRGIDARTAELHQPPTPAWGLESRMRYELLDGDILEMTFECVPRRDMFTNGYIGLFWASYIDRPESTDIHFRGMPDAAGAKEDWLRGVTPLHGTLATHPGRDDRRIFVHDPAFPLELPFGFSRLRYAQPWYYGLCRGMAFIQMFRPGDGIRLTQSPSGGGKGCPAWDFQWFIDAPRIGRSYRMVMRAAYVPVDGPGDSAEVRERIARLAAESAPR